MKLKFFPTAIAAIAFGATLCAIATTSHPLLAQDSTASPDRVTSPMPRPKPRFFLPGLEGIQLTAQQQEQIQQIQKDLQPQFEAVLPRPPQLSPEQQEKVHQLMQASREKIEAVLTPEQQQQLHQHQNQNQGMKPPGSFPPGHPGGKLPPGFAELGLTSQQQAQIEQIMQEMQPQLRAILPPPPQLTAEQQAKLQQLEQSYRDRVEPVLTPEQRQQFQQNLQKLEQHRRERSGNS